MGVGPLASPHHPPDCGAQGPGGGAEALSCRQPYLGWVSVGVRRLEEARGTGLACRDVYCRLLTRWSSRSPVGPGGFKVVRCCWLLGCIVVELRCSDVSVGMVVSGRGAPWCSQPAGRCCHFDPRMPGWFDVGRLACGPFMIWLLFLEQFGWCLVVLAAVWPACSPSGLMRCCRGRLVCFGGSLVFVVTLCVGH